MTTTEPLYDTITPAGALLCTQCDANGHAHTNPDVPLRILCTVHNLEWVWCGACAGLWCPGKLGNTQPHAGQITPHGA